MAGGKFFIGGGSDDRNDPTNPFRIMHGLMAGIISDLEQRGYQVEHLRANGDNCDYEVRKDNAVVGTLGMKNQDGKALLSFASNHAVAAPVIESAVRERVSLQQNIQQPTAGVGGLGT